MLRLVLLLSCFSIPAHTYAWDDAAVTKTCTNLGCPTIPSAISFSDDCHACQYFHITTQCEIEYYHIDIYDRDKHKVYSSYDMHRDWDGSMGASYLPVGCYTYEVLYRIDAGSPLQVHTGTVVFLH